LEDDHDIGHLWQVWLEAKKSDCVLVLVLFLCVALTSWAKNEFLLL
jgi:hypothetical protein